eukprot:4061236-Amphidinium_carterae.1
MPPPRRLSGMTTSPQSVEYPTPRLGSCTDRDSITTSAINAAIQELCMMEADAGGSSRSA